MEKPTRTAAKLEMKQVFRKDAPVTFDPDTVIRHCNASQRELYTGNRMASPRGEAGQAETIASVGIGC